MASITFKHVNKTYEDSNVTVVPDLNLEIKDKEFVVLVGPSGCGKSTTLRMIAGLETVSSGELYIGDKVVNDIPPKDRDIAMVFQTYALYPHMSVYKNMSYALEIRNTPKDEIDKKVREAAQILGLEKYLDRKPRALSGGQRQRVALGRAMVRNPEVFLLDEPLSNLDAKLRTEMRSQIASLHKRLSTTFVYVTHDQTEAMTMGDRIVVMKDGIIQQVDTPQNIYDHPKNLFVASFIGSPQMNFIETKVILESDGVHLLFENGLNVKVNEEQEKRLMNGGYIGRKIIFGIRPEDIYDDKTFITENKNSTFKANVTLYETLGTEVYLYFTIGENKITARVNPQTETRQGDSASFAFDLSKYHLFDKETEELI